MREKDVLGVKIDQDSMYIFDASSWIIPGGETMSKTPAPDFDSDDEDHLEFVGLETESKIMPKIRKLKSSKAVK